MKKKIIFIILVIFCFCSITNVYALNETYTVNGVEYTTDTPDRARDYFYFTYLKPIEESTGNDYEFVLCQYQGKYQFFYFTNNTDTHFTRFTGSGVNQQFYYTATNNCLYKEQNNTNSCQQGERSFYFTSVLYSSYEFKDTNDNILVPQNITKQEIESIYTEDDNPSVNIDFPISKEEYYCLLVFIATLILMLFFKWCFPMKGRRNL